MISRALFFDGPRKVAVRDVTLPAPADGELLVRGLASALSQGTELLLYRGEGPERFDPSLGISSYPCRYGYSWVGAVVEGSSGLNRVFALATHAAAHVLRAENVRAIRADIPAARAALAANLETAVTCTWDAEVTLGDRVVVLGAGLVGTLTAWLLSRTARVTLVDPSPARRASAMKLAPNLRVVESDVPDGRADVVIEATGAPAALDTAIAWAAPMARIVVASFYGLRRAPIDLGDAFHRRRLTLLASQVSSIPPKLAPRWDYARRFAIVEDLLGEPLLDALIGGAVPFERAPELYARLDANQDTPPCHVFEYGN